MRGQSEIARQLVEVVQNRGLQRRDPAAVCRVPDDRRRGLETAEQSRLQPIDDDVAVWRVDEDGIGAGRNAARHEVRQIYCLQQGMRRRIDNDRLNDFDAATRRALFDPGDGKIAVGQSFNLRRAADDIAAIIAEVAARAVRITVAVNGNEAAARTGSSVGSVRNREELRRDFADAVFAGILNPHDRDHVGLICGRRSCVRAALVRGALRRGLIAGAWLALLAVLTMILVAAVGVAQVDAGERRVWRLGDSDDDGPAADNTACLVENFENQLFDRVVARGIDFDPGDAKILTHRFDCRRQIQCAVDGVIRQRVFRYGDAV